MNLNDSANEKMQDNQKESMMLDRNEQHHFCAIMSSADTATSC